MTYSFLTVNSPAFHFQVPKAPTTLMLWQLLPTLHGQIDSTLLGKSGRRGSVNWVNLEGSYHLCMTLPTTLQKLKRTKSMAKSTKSSFTAKEQPAPLAQATLSCPR